MGAVISYWPVAFLVGLFVGLAGSSRWRIVKRDQYDAWRLRQDRDGSH